MNQPAVNKSYATFGMGRSIRQVLHALRSRQQADTNMSLLLQMLFQHEKRMADGLGKPVAGMRILEIGPGQGMERARYFGLHNEVIGLDLDVIPTGFDVAGYARMIRKNGFGRFAKTLGRKLIVGGVNSAAWAKAVGSRNMPVPPVIYGDICQEAPEISGFDVVMSWSVFEHLPDPRAALEHVIESLRPGGILYLSLHLYTSNNGHHDIRAFTGAADTLPLWPHLRPSLQNQIDPSSYLNQWRLNQWRSLFAEIAPGHEEFLEQYDHPAKYGPSLEKLLKTELNDYTEEELLTVDVIYLWKKP